jgi:hypothetical protein
MEADMPELLTWEEMTQRYDGEWLLIVDAELNDDLSVVRGEVLAHSPNQEVVYDALPLRQGRSASIEYVGQVPEDLAFIL